MFDFRIWIRIILRCLLEFGPPTAFAVYATWPNLTSSWVNFSAAFVGVGLFWWNFLRIQYQQTNRASQDKASEQIEQVQNNLTRVEGMLRAIIPIVDRGDLSPEQTIEISKVVHQANNAIATANTTLETVHRKSLNFSFGPIKAQYETRTGPPLKKRRSG